MGVSAVRVASKALALVEAEEKVTGERPALIGGVGSWVVVGGCGGRGVEWGDGKRGWRGWARGGKRGKGVGGLTRSSTGSTRGLDLGRP